MTEREKDPAAVELGRKGGQASGGDKAKAARENIQKAIAARWKGHTAKRRKKDTPSPNPVRPRKKR
jgi:general stress protein YciG